VDYVGSDLSDGDHVFRGVLQCVRVIVCVLVCVCVSECVCVSVCGVCEYV